MTIMNNVDIAQLMNAALQNVAEANKIEKPNVTFVGNDKGLSMSFVDNTGAEQTVAFGGVKLDVPKGGDTADRTEGLIKALDGLKTGERDGDEIKETKNAVGNLFKTGGNAGDGGSTVEAIDIYQLMALLVKVFQKQRETSAISRDAAHAQAVSSIEAQIGEMKDAATWGFFGSLVCSGIQLGMSIASCVSAGKQIGAANRCETANGVKLADTNFATAKLIDNPVKAEANATKLGNTLQKLDATAFEQVSNDLKFQGGVKDIPLDARQAKAEVVLAKYEGAAKAAAEAYKRAPTAENFKALQVAQGQQAYAFAKLTAAKAEGLTKLAPADQKLASQEWKAQAGDARADARAALKNDPEYAKIQTRLSKVQLADAVAKPIAEMGKAGFEYIAKTKEADAKRYEINQRTADKMAEAMTDVYKEAKQLMDDVRGFLQSKMQSEIETLRKIMV